VIDDLWYKNAVVYCLDVKTFQDSNGDGVGDFEGLARRLDYLSGIGVGAVWLLPFYPSPKRDNGYDITDFYGVDPKLGSLGDFVDFTHEARKHGIRVLIDLVVNHTSDQHPWFKAAVQDPGSPYRDWYVWSKRKPRNADTGMVFPGVQRTTWTYHPKAKSYYFHRFYKFQPDLNLSNPQVREEVQRIMGFWLQLGVSGFRMDAVPFVIQKEGPDGPTREQFRMLRDLRSFLQWRTGDAIILGEANVLPRKNRDYFGEDGDRMHMMFNFQVNQSAFYALASGDVRPLVKSLERTRVSDETSQWAHFLRNNDELDLGRLTNAQRKAVFAEFGPEKTMQLYDRGIRRRLAPMFNGDRRRLELAYSLLFTLPGTPVIRYGDELGMGEDLALPERNCGRTPMQWSTEPNAGFSIAQKPILPVVSDGPFGFCRINAAAQKGDPTSLLNWTERIIRARKECPEVGWGSWKVLRTSSPRVLALRYDWRNNAVLFLHSFDSKALSVTFGAGSANGAFLANLLSDNHSRADGRGQHTIEMEGYGYRWFRVGGLDYILKRSR
jgi:maltose alpha-D-glucosyltransferase / alpha-amylase